MRATGQERAWLRLAVMLLLTVGLVATACGGGSGGSDESAGDDASEQAEQGGGVEEGNSSGGGGVGAAVTPIRVAAVPQEGDTPEELKAFVEESVEPDVISSCGGSLCITFRFVDQNGREATDNECRYNPKKSTGAGREHQVNPGGTVTYRFDDCPTSTEQTTPQGGEGEQEIPTTTRATDSSGSGG